MNYSVVILSYNHPDLTSQCIDSVLKFSQINHIYLVHNGSIPKHSEQLKKKFPQIIHLTVTQNKGFTGGANYGLQKAFETEKLVLFLTNDTLLLNLPDKLDADLCSIKVLRRKSDSIDSTIGRLNIKTGRLEHLKEWSNDKNSNYKYYVPGSAFWISKKTFLATQGFDENLHSYWEDVDLSLRAQNQGITLTYSAETIVSHKIGKTTGGQDFYSYYLYQRNRKRIMKKHKLSHWRFWILFLVDVLRLSRLRWRKLRDILMD